MNSQQPTQQQQQIIKRQHAYQESTQQYVESPYKHQEFPKWKYRPGEKEVLVSSAAEEGILGPGWQDVPPETEKENGVAPDSDELRQENEELKREISELRKKTLSARTTGKAARKRKQPMVSADPPVETTSAPEDQQPETSS